MPIFYLGYTTTSTDYQMQLWDNKFDKYFGSTLSNEMQLNYDVVEQLNFIIINLNTLFQF